MAKKYAAISVVIPFYRAEKSIENCLLSILNQTVIPDEVIIVDDGSDANSIVLDSLVEKYSSEINLRISRLPINMGAPSARNVGISLARNDIIALIDSDDYWVCNKIEMQLKIFNDSNIDLLCGEYSPTPPSANYLCNSEAYRISILDILKKNISPVTLMFRKDLNLRFDERLRRCDDFKFSITALADNKCIYKMKSIVSFGTKPMIGSSGLTGSIGLMSASFLFACVLICIEKPKYVLYMIFFVLFELVKLPVRYVRVILR